jgi:hypothetical protein
MDTKQFTSFYSIVKLRSELELSPVRAGGIPCSSDPAQCPCSCLHIVYQNEAPMNGNWKIFFVAFKTLSVALQRDDKLQGNLRLTVASRVKTAITMPFGSIRQPKVRPVGPFLRVMIYRALWVILTVT